MPKYLHAWVARSSERSHKVHASTQDGSQLAWWCAAEEALHPSAAITAGARAAQVTWMIYTAAGWPNTSAADIVLAVQLFDKFYTTQRAKSGATKAWACAALQLATKVLGEYTDDYYADGFAACTRDEVIRAESQMAVALRWRVGIPTAMNFLCLFIDALQLERPNPPDLVKAEETCTKIMLQALVDGTHFSVLPSHFAAQVLTRVVGRKRARAAVRRCTGAQAAVTATAAATADN